MHFLLLHTKILHILAKWLLCFGLGSPLQASLHYQTSLLYMHLYTIRPDTIPKQSAPHQNKLTIINVAIGPDYFSGNKVIYIKIVINNFENF